MNKICGVVLSVSLVALPFTVLPAGATSDAHDPNTFSVTIKSALQDIVRNVDFPQQQATIADLVRAYPNNWYSLVNYQPVLWEHNAGGAVMDNCRGDMNVALGTGKHLDLVKAANQCVDRVEMWFQQSGATAPTASIHSIRARIQEFAVN